MFISFKMGFPHSSVCKESACNAGKPGLIPGSWGSPGEGNGYPLNKYSGLENSWVAKSQTWQSNFYFHFSNFTFPGGSDGKESAFKAGDSASIPGLEKSPGGGNDYSLQHAKECSNYCTIALISHASEVILKFLQAQASTVHEPWITRCSSWL